MTADEARALDVEIAEKVMGWDHKHDVDECGDPWFSYCRNCGLTGGELQDEQADGIQCYQPPHYSTDIAAAWEVWVKMAAANEWEMRALSPENDHVGIWRFGEWIAGDCPAPEAICRAALKAVVESALT